MAKPKKPSSQHIADAVLEGDAALLRTLLERGGNANSVYYLGRRFLRALTTLQVKKCPLLVLAAMTGRADLVSLLLEHGADVDAPAVSRDYPHIVVDMLVEFPKTNALTIAAMKGHLDVVELLLKAGADVKPEIEDKTPLKEARRGRHQQIFDLLKAHGAG